MSCRQSVPIGITSPNGVRIRMRRKFSDDDWDPQTVSAASIGWEDPDGNTGTWDATFSGATQDVIVIDHVFSAYTIPRPVGDIDRRGSWRVWAIATIPGGVKKSVPGILDATEAGELVPDC